MITPFQLAVNVYYYTVLLVSGKSSYDYISKGDILVISNTLLVKY